MKISQITEATYENVSLIENIVDYIMAYMPSSIPENSEYKFGYFARGGNSGNDWLRPAPSSEIKSIKELIEENKNNPKLKSALEALPYTIITFYNTEEFLKHNAYGEYHYGPIRVFVSRIQKSTREFILRYDDTTEKYPSHYYSKLTSTLFHEIRHFFQDFTYNQHMRNPQRDVNKKTGETRPWGERQVEWDAKWSDRIYNYDPADYSNVNYYVNDVMDDYLEWVKISDKIKNHYRKKTAAYYLEWYRKRVESVWNKTLKSMEPNILKGYYDRNETVELVLEELSWYYSGKGGELPDAIKRYYKIKTIKYFENLTVPLKQKKKLETVTDKYYDEWKSYLDNFLNSNYNRIGELNTYGASSAIVNRLMDNHPDFFYSKKKPIYELAHEVNKHFYKKTVEIIKNIKANLQYDANNKGNA